MSYFDTIQQYASNNNELQQHAMEMGQQFASEKASTLKDKYDSINGDIEKWGGVLQGASSGWWMGRKIIRKIRTYTPDEQTRTQGGEKGEFNEEEMGKLGDTEKGALKFGDKPEADPDNPFGEKPPEPDTQPPSNGDEPPEPEGTSAGADVADVVAEPIEGAVEGSLADISSNIGATANRASGVLDRINAINQRMNNPDAPDPRQSTPETDENGTPKPNETPKPTEPEGSSGSDADALNNTKPIANETENATNNLVDQSTKNVVDDGTKAVLDNVVEKTGIKGVEIAGETIADAIPVVGEIVAVGTMIGGLFRDLFDKHHEAVKEAQAKLVGQSEGIRQVGGMDTSAIASTAGAVAGLV